MELLDRVSEIRLDEKNVDHLKYTEEDYRAYLGEILALEPKVLDSLLLSLKDSDVINNHEADIDDPLYLMTYSRLQKITALDTIVKALKKNHGSLKKEDVIEAHSVLMQGAMSDIGDGLRKDNDKFVGAINRDGTQRVDYRPIDFKEIDSTLDKLMDYINTKGEDNPFIKPIIAHAIMATMQAFNDGNTRMSRIVEHANIWTITNELYNSNLKLPALYLSKNYFLTYRQYRSLQQELAINPNSETWNQWIKYNLNMIDEQLYFLNNNVDKIKRNL